MSRREKKKARSEKTEFANKKKNYDIRCHGRLRMPRAIRRAKKTGTSCRFMTHGIDQSASWNAATPASRDRTIFATFTASAPHTVYRELRILHDPPYTFKFLLQRIIIPARLLSTRYFLFDNSFR